MELYAVLLSGAALVAACIAAWAGVSRRNKPPEGMVTREELDASEQRVLKAVADARDAHGEALTRTANDSVDRVRREIQTFGESVTARFDTLGERVQASLKEGREEQQKGLKEISAASAELAEKVTTTLTAFGDRNAEANKTAREELGDALDKLQRTQRDASEAQTKTLTELREAIAASLEKGSAELKTSQAQSREELGKALERLVESEKSSREAQAKAFTELQDRLNLGLDKMRTENEAKLEKIRLTVEEKLQETLQKQVSESFRQVSERLEQVHKGLGEMQTLATGVGDLKRVLTNVRTRGTYGEVQLRALLEEALAPAQYEENVATRPNSGERVEFAILLPGRDDADARVRLPIDAKFPQEDYLRLVDAYERADAAEAESARKALGTRLEAEAKKIRQKYVEPPHTTDFAILFVPTEGLFAEALRIGGLTEKLQTQYHVVIAGPTTLLALLNSLQMGFQTLAIQKRSGEVWKILAAVKTEFAKFGASLDAVSKKLTEAQNKIGDSQRRSRVMGRHLKTVSELDAEEALNLLPGIADEDDDGDAEDVEEPSIF